MHLDYVFPFEIHLTLKASSTTFPRGTIPHSIMKRSARRRVVAEHGQTVNCLIVVHTHRIG